MQYTFTFRECDIVPEMAVRTNDWDAHGRSRAINEVLGIPPDAEVLWADIEGTLAGEELYTVTALNVGEERDALIQEKYKNYKLSRGI